MQSLLNLHILICRPEHQAAELTRMLAEQGAIPHLFPVMDIVSLPLSLSRDELEQADSLIFTSANAVIPAKEAWVKTGLSWPPSAPVFAIGAATAHTLKLEGCSAYFPAQMNSEGLLAHPLLAEITHQSILIFGGEQPRLLLQETLLRRAAHISYINCYRRELRQHHLLFSEQKDLLNQVDVIIITSEEILQNLIKNFDSSLVKVLWEKAILIINPRLEALLYKQGFTRPPIIADNPNNTSIITALTSWYKEYNI